jgi:TfoX/Sxy family transcriptional regulator of competence genes
MASTKEYLDFVLEQLSELDEVSFRAMMGEYILYYRGRLFGGIYDDRLLVKPVPSAVKLMPDAAMELPYDGAKEMILVDDVDNREFLCELVRSMWEDLPRGKRRNNKMLSIFTVMWLKKRKTIYNWPKEKQDVDAKTSASFFLQEYLIILNMQRMEKKVWIRTKLKYSKTSRSEQHGTKDRKNGISRLLTWLAFLRNRKL